MIGPVKEIEEFESACHAYITRQTRKCKNNKLYQSIHDAHKLIQKMIEVMENASKIEISVTDGMSRMMISLKDKEILLKNVLAIASEMKIKILEENVIGKMNKRRKQTADDDKCKIRKTMYPQEIDFKCLNSTLSWSQAFLAAACDQIKYVPSPFTVREIIQFANDVR